MSFDNRPSPNRSSRKGFPVGMVVIHGDAGKSDMGTVSWLQNPKSRVSYHYLVGRDGTVYRFVPETDKAWHAGKSEWKGASVHGSLNPVSVGVAFANDGGEPYKPVQYKVGGKLVADICARHDIQLRNIRGHYEVSPGRKSDPWSHFDWGEFYRHLGLSAGGRTT